MLRPRELSRSVSLFPARTPTLPPATHTNSYALGHREVLLCEAIGESARRGGWVSIPPQPSGPGP